MRVLLWIVVVAAGLWSAYWFAGSTVVERAATGWFEQAGEQGLTALNDGLRVAGYPNRFDLTVTAPDLADPASGYGWRADFVQVLAMTWKPWHLIALLPPTQTFTTPEGEVSVTSTRLRGSLVLHPGSDLALNRTVIEAADLAIITPTGTTRLATANLATAEDATRLHSHRIGARLTGLAPDPARMAGASGLPPALSALTLDAHLLLSAALDRHVGETRPEITGLVLDGLAVDWGDLQVTATGSVATTSDGRAEGRIDFVVQNWRLLPGALGALGVVQPELAPTLLRALEIMAEDAPDPARLDLPLTFKSGRMLLGPLPIGFAPVLAQRQ